MPVSDQHPEYTKFLPQWQTVNDCVEGSATIKKQGTKYLPMPNPEDKSSENRARFDAYLKRANFVNFTGHTKAAMSGMVFRKAIKSELPTAIDYLETDADGGGLTLEQMVREVLGETLETGRYGLLVDYPESEEGATQAQTQGKQASIKTYPASSVINWRTVVIDGVKKLSLVVLLEPMEILNEDGFGSQVKQYYRALWLIEGVYMQELYDENMLLVKAYVPRTSDGSAWTEIPFIFVGAENNDETVDEAPLYDLAEVNIAHYRNSADYEESSFMVGQPTLFISGLTETWANKYMKNGIALGSRGGILGNEGSSANLLQADPNQMPAKGMEAKEEQMVKIGARIIMDNTGTETAEAARIRFAGQNSLLGAIVGNIESALKKCFEWAGLFMGSTEEAMIEINKEFYDKSLDPQLVMALIQLTDLQVMAKTDLRGTVRRAGWIDASRTDEDIDAEIATTGPLSLPGI